MKYKIVDKIQTLKDYIDGKIKNEDIEVINFECDEILNMSELMVADIHDDKIIFIRKIY